MVVFLDQGFLPSQQAGISVGRNSLYDPDCSISFHIAKICFCGTKKFVDLLRQAKFIFLVWVDIPNSIINKVFLNTEFKKKGLKTPEETQVIISIYICM